MDWGKLLGDIAPSLIGFGTGLVMNHQQVQKAKGEANDAKSLAELQYQTVLQNQQNIKLMQQAGQAPPEKEKSNLPLYIGLGVGGVVILGVLIFAVTRKSN